MSTTDRSIRSSRYEAISPEAKRRRRGGRRRGLRIILLSILSVVVLVAAFLIWSVLGAYFTPGNESFSAKWADWMRDHHASALVLGFENYYYSTHQPAKGGQPKDLNPIQKSSVEQAALGHAPANAKVLPAPAPVPLVVSPALPGEGAWQPIGPVIEGSPSMYEAQFRADTIYTSQITTAVWIDPLRLRLSLIPGLTEPGGSWPHPPYITPTELPTAIAAFNGGFRVQDAHGGFYLDGRTAVPLRTGAASFVIYSNGRIDIGAWGREVTMTPNVVAVMQNLVPMVDNGQVARSASYDDRAVWGTTIKTSIVVPRSGIGVTADGALVYVAGPALSAKTLAESLQRAGAVRAMTLDINPEWVTFNTYSHPYASNPSDVIGSKLYPEMQRPSYRYLPPTEESRDFVEVSV